MTVRCPRAPAREPSSKARAAHTSVRHTPGATRSGASESGQGGSGGCTECKLLMAGGGWGKKLSAKEKQVLSQPRSSRKISG